MVTTFGSGSTVLVGEDTVFFATESGRTTKSDLTQPIEPYWNRTLYQSPDFARTATLPPETLVTKFEVVEGALRTLTLVPLRVARPSGAGPFAAVTLERLELDLDVFFEEFEEAVLEDFREFREDLAVSLLDL
jgi:hypothetical protein